MKPAPLRFQLGMYIIYMPHIYTQWQFSMSLKFNSLWWKAKKGDLNVSLARLFIHTMRWILIITGSVTCLDMSRDLLKKKKNHWFSIIVTWSGVVFFSCQRCELRRINNQQIKKRNFSIFSNNVKRLKRASIKDVEIILHKIVVKATASMNYCWSVTFYINILYWTTPLCYKLS